MPTIASVKPRRDSLNLRIAATERQLIDLTVVSPEVCEEFLQRLDRPAAAPVPAPASVPAQAQKSIVSETENVRGAPSVPIAVPSRKMPE
ncbi:hypothetical protein [Xylophilus sp.]|uniref:hypothetical protein n=1 Tax=Xylophilus sp. TaxID=2653893 RepID=UPI0013B62571|nr:hypothetical protein [Xylophilus sp.]KAF1048779.1 MAG: hypothetical protein GAK38_01223 [Xylophilus sp.]